MSDQGRETETVRDLLAEYGAEVVLRYTRENRGIRVTTRGLTNHELRDILTGFWAGLGEADRAEHVEELRHYAELLRDPAAYPERHLPTISEAIAAARRFGDEGT